MATMSKKNQITNRIISMIIGVLVGVVLVVLGSVIKAETLVWLALVVWGVVTIISNVPGLVNSIANIKEKGSIFDLVCSILGILLGVGLIISQNDVITVIVAAYMVVFPVIRILLAKSNWGEQLKREALRIILGVLMLVFGGVLLGIGMTVLNILMSVIGWVVIALTVVFGLVEIIRLATVKEIPVGPKTYVDVDGDGTVDEVQE